MGQQTSTLQPEDLLELTASSSLKEDEVNRLYKRFQHLDKENKGMVTVDEFFAIPELAVNPLAPRIIDVVDLNGRKEINFKQFVSALSVFSKEAKREEKLKFAFRVYDVNGDGKIDSSDLFQIVKAMVGANIPDEEIENIVQETISEADVLDSDGAISFLEFKRAMFNADLENILTIEF